MPPSHFLSLSLFFSGMNTIVKVIPVLLFMLLNSYYIGTYLEWSTLLILCAYVFI